MGAREAIEHLINRYGFTIDTGDLEGFAALFEPGEWTIEGLEPRRGKQEMLDVLSNVIIYEDGTPRTKYLTSNVDIRVAEDSCTATAECYVTILQQNGEFPLRISSAGHYFDDFEWVDGNWRFARREVRNVLMGDASAHLKGAAG